LQCTVYTLTDVSNAQSLVLKLLACGKMQQQISPHPVYPRLIWMFSHQ